MRRRARASPRRERRRDQSQQSGKRMGKGRKTMALNLVLAWD
jgi:hypothetical protein